MPKITYISFDGKREAIDVENGISLMEAAIKNGIDGIDGDCGGVCACATCKVLVDAAWIDKIGAADGDERAMLDFRAETPPNSRLACQIIASPEIDGMEVRMPSNQDGAVFSEV